MDDEVMRARTAISLEPRASCRLQALASSTLQAAVPNNPEHQGAHVTDIDAGNAQRRVRAT
ncbi:hypothetical protein SAJA_03150 [Salinisphaera japonica YTM-1]|uniref:Uncharacterized protein n=1 Tax=Salinisphaera japonica YTM-1 TaxID=1209778 RepID=A0A423Q027_9GAMM|nr:hypothetical protein SAJA_03150 [Salinisphaera japonica YTM-1]